MMPRDEDKDIWIRRATVDDLNHMLVNNMTGHVGIRFTAIGPDYLEGTMPVDGRTVQPFGILHGGASVVLAETLASVAGHLCSKDGQTVAGIEVNANHIRSVTSGHVTGRASPIHRGASTQVWRVQIRRWDGSLVCESRITLAVVANVPVSKRKVGQ